MSIPEHLSISEISDQDRAALHETIEENVRLALAGDWQAFSELYVDDVLLMPPNAPAVKGRDEIPKMFAGVQMKEFSSQLLEASGRGDVAYGHGEHSWTMVIEGLPEPVSDSGKWLAVWQRQSDGRWLLAVDMWNSNLPTTS